MADTPEQAEARRQLAARGNELAPRVDASTGKPANAPSAPSARAGRATERRAVVKGAVTAGPAGAARGAAKGRAETRKTRSAASSRASSRARTTRGGPGIASLSGPATGALFAEYFAGALIITFQLFTDTPSRGYLPTVSKVMMRLTALTAIFFVLFLMQGSKRGAQFAVWFGLLVDLGVIFTAARSQTFSTMADMIGNKGTPAGTQTVSADSGGSAAPSSGDRFGVPATPPGTQLPDE